MLEHQAGHKLRADAPTKTSKASLRFHTPQHTKKKAHFRHVSTFLGHCMSIQPLYKIYIPTTFCSLWCLACPQNLVPLKWALFFNILCVRLSRRTQRAALLRAHYSRLQRCRHVATLKREKVRQTGDYCLGTRLTTRGHKTLPVSAPIA